MSQNTEEDDDVVPAPVPAAVRKWTRTDADVSLTPDDSMAISRPGLSLREVFDTMKTPPPSCDLLTCDIVREWVPTLLNGSGSIETRLFHTCPNGCGLVFCGDCLDIHESWCNVPTASPRRYRDNRVQPRPPRGGFHRLVEGSTSESRCVDWNRCREPLHSAL